MTVDSAPSKREKNAVGRPRLEIDFNAVAEAAAAVFAENGYEGVSIDAVAEKLDISRATLYRTVPTKSHLMGILFERATEELNLSATALVAQDRDPESTLLALIRLQIGTAVQLRQYMNVFFGGAGLSPEMYARWRAWTRDYERVWIGVVGRAMDAGVIPVDDPVISARLMLGMINWVSRWYRPSDGYTAEAIAEVAVRLISQSTTRPA